LLGASERILMLAGILNEEDHTSYPLGGLNMGEFRSYATLSGIAALSLLGTFSGDAANAAVGVERYWTGGRIETEEILCDRFACPRGSFTIRLVADDAYGSRMSGNTVDQVEFSFPQPMEAGTKILSAEIIEESDLYHCEIVERAEEVFPVEAAINAANPIRVVKVQCTITAKGRKVYDDTRAEKEASDSLLSQQGTGENRQVLQPPISPGDGILSRSGGAGGRAVQAGFAQAEQWERDAPQREAAARAEEVRRAEESRQHEEWLRKREEKQARRASGGDGWATFINVLGAVAGAALEVQAQQAAAEGEASADAEDSEGNCGPYGPGTCQ
jgi:hypothetical protein